MCFIFWIFGEIVKNKLEELLCNEMDKPDIVLIQLIYLHQNMVNVFNTVMVNTNVYCIEF